MSLEIAIVLLPRELTKFKIFAYESICPIGEWMILFNRTDRLVCVVNGLDEAVFVMVSIEITFLYFLGYKK